MKCLRCGYCCKTSLVVIVNNPDHGPIDGNLKAIDASTEPCHHLLGDKPGNYSCTIHDKPWYPETPCFAHSQIEQKDSNCRMGEYVLSTCEHCKGEDGCVYPYYGLAPHKHKLNPSSNTGLDTKIDNPTTWPENFFEDPEAPGCGTYTHCLECGAPQKRRY